MPSNPYESPKPRSPGADVETYTRRSSVVRHSLPVVCIAVLSYVLAMLLTPADPVSFILGFALLTAVMLAIYVWGVRIGKRSRSP